MTSCRWRLTLWQLIDLECLLQRCRSLRKPLIGYLTTFISQYLISAARTIPEVCGFDVHGILRRRSLQADASFNEFAESRKKNKMKQNCLDDFFAFQQKNRIKKTCFFCRVVDVIGGAVGGSLGVGWDSKYGKDMQIQSKSIKIII